MIYFLGWLLIIFLGLKVWNVSSVRAENAWPSLKKSAVGLSLKLSGLNFLERWFTPGLVVQKLSFKAGVKTLPRGRLNLSPLQFYSFKQCLLFTAGVAFLVWLWVGEITLGKVLLYAATGLGVTLLPDLYLLKVVQQDDRQMEREGPYFLDLLTLTLQGGSNLEQALVSTTIHYESLLSQTVALKLKELDWGQSLESVLMSLKKEIKSDDFKHFLESVLRAKKLGVSLSETLIIQGEILRTKRRQKAEELSRTAAIKMSIPLVLFIFPALLIIYIGPGILQLLART